jgi:hypothetical protein
MWWSVDGMQVDDEAALDPTNVNLLLYKREHNATVPVGP